MQYNASLIYDLKAKSATWKHDD